MQHEYWLHAKRSMGKFRVTTLTDARLSGTGTSVLQAWKKCKKKWLQLCKRCNHDGRSSLRRPPPIDRSHMTHNPVSIACADYGTVRTFPGVMHVIGTPGEAGVRRERDCYVGNREGRTQLCLARRPIFFRQPVVSAIVRQTMLIFFATSNSSRRPATLPSYSHDTLISHVQYLPDRILPLSSTALTPGGHFQIMQLKER